MCVFRNQIFTVQRHIGLQINALEKALSWELSSVKNNPDVTVEKRFVMCTSVDLGFLRSGR